MVGGTQYRIRKQFLPTIRPISANLLPAMAVTLLDSQSLVCGGTDKESPYFKKTKKVIYDLKSKIMKL